jgi:hypothetical protein
LDLFVSVKFFGHGILMQHIFLSFFLTQQNKLVILAAIVASASAFAPAPVAFTRGAAVYAEDEEPKKGSGGMFDTRDPEAKVDEDPRKSIGEAPSFEEYQKQQAAAREAEGN